MQWLKFKLIKKPYYDPRADRILPYIKGRKNIKGVDEFDGGGLVYPEIAMKYKIIDMRENGSELMLLLDEDSAAIQKIQNMSGEAIYNVGKKKIAYDVSKHTPQTLTKQEALHELKNSMKLPNDTTLDVDGKPIITAEVSK